MKILCLHGVGSSGSICESQFSPLLRRIDPSFELIFVDGPVECERGPGMGLHLEGPFFSHTAGYSPGAMIEALEHLDATINDLGPFDGVFGFSQGGALALSYMHQQQVSGNQAPFKFALCFSSVIPCSSDAGYCQSIIQRLCTVPWHNIRVPSEDSLDLTREERQFRDLLLQTVIPARKNNALLPAYDMSVYMNGDGSEAPRVMHPQLLREKIRTPTVHIWGKRDFDFMRNMSDAASGLCEEHLTKKLEHSGGHQPPQKDPEIKAVLRALEWAINQSERVGGLHL
ncbi:hypothetical protein AJ79_01021 [Helicocarpus griseus UAMH5409]|uniref:Serine hydrolase domain-containing protein n=1 Tax=Helicocarpus griseus UAMH5409 TaxID=1447875 RepID=A0A2B7Y992_9EURO|nr:hypothetical protein AJ79_01021 [Helicocarpus griseus UAMH5409]